MPDGDAERHSSGVSPEHSRRPDVHYPFNVDEYAVPTLPSRSLADTLAFYERLGFGNAGDPAEVWDYMIIRRGTIELHFYVDDQVARPTTPTRCFVWVNDADALHAEWERAGVANG